MPRVATSPAFGWLLFDRAPVASVLADQGGHILRVNAAFGDLFGYSGDEACGLGIDDITHPEDRTLSHDHIDPVSRGALASTTYPKRYLRKDGTPIWATVTVSALVLDGRNCMLGQIVDHSSVHRALDEVASSQRRLDEIAQTISEVFWSADPALGRMLYVSPGYERVWGRSCESLYREPRSFIDAVHPDDRARVVAVLDGEREGRPFDHEYRIVRPDGEERWIWDRGFPVRGPGGGPVTHFVGVALDVTARKRVESELRLFRELVDRSSDAIEINDPQTLRILDVNQRACRDLGYTREELLGLTVYDIDPALRPEMLGELEARLAREGEAVFESVHRRKDGSTFPVEINLRRVELGRSYYVVVVHDLTERKRVELQQATALARSRTQLDALARISRAQALADGDMEAGAREIAQLAAAVFGAGRANVWLFSASGSELRCIESWDVTSRTHTAGAVLAEEHFRPEFAALRAGRYVDAEDALTDPRTAGYVEGYARPLNIRGMLDVLIQAAGRDLGLLCIEHVGRTHRWRQDEIAFACQLADKLGLAIAASELRQGNQVLQAQLGRVERVLESTIQALASAMETRDPYTAGHQRSVAAIAVAIGTRIGLSAEALHGLRLAALVHDIGKLNVPAEILSKPGRLTPAEYALVQQHAEAGYQILKDIEFPWPVADIVRQHHERLDGSGYPRGLRGAAILREARVLAVADMFEAISAHRPYRPALGATVACAELRRLRGVQYDEAAVDACIALYGADESQPASAIPPASPATTAP